MDEHVAERDYRCPKCARLNFRGYLAPGSFIRMRCYRDRCRAWLLIENGKTKVIDAPVVIDKIDNVVIVV